MRGKVHRRAKIRYRRHVKRKPADVSKPKRPKLLGVYLTPETERAVRIAAIDQHTSISAVVEKLCRAGLGLAEHKAAEK